MFEHSTASDAPLGALISTQEAADLIGLAPQTLTAYRCERRGPRYYKIGRRCLYLPDDLKTWIASRAVDPAREAA